MSRRLTVTSVVVALLGVLAACGSSDSEPVTARAATSAAVTTPAPSVAASVAAPSAAVTTPSPDGDGDGPSVPAETAGDLDSSDVPAPPDLGSGWAQYVDPGAAEDGYVGNGSWVRARGSEEVVQAVVPLGCTGLTRMPRLPVPAHALEATYRGPGGAPAVALVLDYARVAQARELVEQLGAIGRACPAPPDRVRRSDPLVAVVTQTRADATTVLDRRREYGVGASEWVWSEAVVRDGARVGMLVVGSLPGRQAPDLGRLHDAVRASVRG